ncbi:MAG: hypothetical protein HQ582_11115 [Planctomycetes bacterium]|nr:hypothetical protein [Planctomycetota bacterium]
MSIRPFARRFPLPAFAVKQFEEALPLPERLNLPPIPTEYLAIIEEENEAASAARRIRSRFIRYRMINSCVLIGSILGGFVLMGLANAADNNALAVLGGVVFLGGIPTSLVLGLAVVLPAKKKAEGIDERLLNYDPFWRYTQIVDGLCSDVFFGDKDLSVLLGFPERFVAERFAFLIVSRLDEEESFRIETPRCYATPLSGCRWGAVLKWLHRVDKPSFKQAHPALLTFLDEREEYVEADEPDADDGLGIQLRRDAIESCHAVRQSIEAFVKQLET